MSWRSEREPRIDYAARAARAERAAHTNKQRAQTYTKPEGYDNLTTIDLREFNPNIRSHIQTKITAAQESHTLCLNRKDNHQPLTLEEAQKPKDRVQQTNRAIAQATELSRLQQDLNIPAITQAINRLNAIAQLGIARERLRFMLSSQGDGTGIVDIYKKISQALSESEAERIQLLDTLTRFVAPSRRQPVDFGTLRYAMAKFIGRLIMDTALDNTWINDLRVLFSKELRQRQTRTPDPVLQQRDPLLTFAYKIIKLNLVIDTKIQQDYQTRIRGIFCQLLKLHVDNPTDHQTLIYNLCEHLCSSIQNYTMDETLDQLNQELTDQETTGHSAVQIAENIMLLIASRIATTDQEQLLDGFTSTAARYYPSNSTSTLKQLACTINHLNQKINHARVETPWYQIWEHNNNEETQIYESAKRNLGRLLTRAAHDNPDTDNPIFSLCQNLASYAADCNCSNNNSITQFFTILNQHMDEASPEASPEAAQNPTAIISEAVAQFLEQDRADRLTPWRATSLAMMLYRALCPQAPVRFSRSETDTYVATLREQAGISVDERLAGDGITEMEMRKI